jgi:tetratricopeptide (TPR) repeat protein
MKMKKNIIYILVSVMALTSCKKFLDEAPRTTENVVNFFKNENDFNLALDGAYAAVRGIYGSKSAWVMGEMRSDNTHYDYKPSDQALAVVQRYNVADFTDDQFNTQASPKWVTCYVAVSRTNAILDHMDGADFSQASKDKITGETKFLRALAYFELVRYYGDVPLYTHSIDNRLESYVARTPVADVYSQIVSDATDAAQKLAAPAFPQSGRVTKGAALTLLADVYITQKNFAAAEPLLKQVVQMGYTLFPNYADVYLIANKNSKESIFEIQYSAAITGQNSSFIYNFIPRMSNSTVVTGTNQNTVTDLGGFNTPTQDLINSYEPADKRLDASIAVAEGTFNSSDDFTATAVKSIVGYTAPVGKTGRPFTKKYLHTHALAGQTDDNWPVYRYAEVLLLLAESLNEQGKSAEALTWLNQVRTRAGLAVSTETNQAALRTVILHERRVELAFENKRWPDLLRTGNAIPVMTAFGVKQKQLYSYLVPDSYNITQDRLLFPVPYSEMQLNAKLVQNHGY